MHAYYIKTTVQRKWFISCRHLANLHTSQACSHEQRSVPGAACVDVAAMGEQQSDQVTPAPPHSIEQGRGYSACRLGLVHISTSAHQHLCCCGLAVLYG